MNAPQMIAVVYSFTYAFYNAAPDFTAWYEQEFGEDSRGTLGTIQGITKYLLPYLKKNFPEGMGVWATALTAAGFDDTSLGYAATDYKEVNAHLGNVKHVKELAKALADKDIPFYFDMVPNHTSNEHKWFKESCKRDEPNNPCRDYYNWVKPLKSTTPLPVEFNRSVDFLEVAKNDDLKYPVTLKNDDGSLQLDENNKPITEYIMPIMVPDGQGKYNILTDNDDNIMYYPNNWVRFGRYDDPETGLSHFEPAYHLHPDFKLGESDPDKLELVMGEFAPTMPKLNMANADVLAEIVEAIRVWVEEYGVTGIRIDAAAHVGTHEFMLCNDMNRVVVAECTSNQGNGTFPTILASQDLFGMYGAQKHGKDIRFEHSSPLIAAIREAFPDLHIIAEYGIVGEEVGAQIAKEHKVGVYTVALAQVGDFSRLRKQSEKNRELFPKGLCNILALDTHDTQGSDCLAPLDENGEREPFTNAQRKAVIDFWMSQPAESLVAMIPGLHGLETPKIGDVLGDNDSLGLVRWAASSGNLDTQDHNSYRGAIPHTDNPNDGLTHKRFLTPSEHWRSTEALEKDPDSVLNHTKKRLNERLNDAVLSKPGHIRYANVGDDLEQQGVFAFRRYDEDETDSRLIFINMGKGPQTITGEMISKLKDDGEDSFYAESMTLQSGESLFMPIEQFTNVHEQVATVSLG